ncbi:Diphthamide biosynthesis protein 2 [Physocladia obscura]|uniref:2-(3-amino-3-carboxypropyl)histidine synthase subunit 2 n=1 Tax=Physocladia obscura TaxID=109957 RepID=A0AAD5T684_9FUNG|nr:Diphthamide biosynthesis protein 2 [Physocladia obscura]
MDINSAFEIDRTLCIVADGGYFNIALQFPDDLLAHATDVALLLNYRANNPQTSALKTFYIMADTTYGSCCVDEISAAHVNADLVVHYGRSCLSRTSRIPVLYVFGSPPVDFNDCVSSLSAFVPLQTPILFLYDAIYCNSAVNIVKVLAEKGFSDIVVSTIDTEVGVVSSVGYAREILDSAITSYGRKYVIPEGRDLKEYTIIYIGGESLTLTNIIMTHNSLPSFSYDPALKIAREENSTINKLLRRRYVMVQKAKDADVIGIVVGTLGVGELKSITFLLHSILPVRLLQSIHVYFNLMMTFGIWKCRLNASHLMHDDYRFSDTSHILNYSQINLLFFELKLPKTVSYLPLIDHLKRLISASGKKAYMIAVGKPSPSKLGNFAEIDAFVIVACPENTLVDSKEFLRPIVTPFELEIALVGASGGREWNGEYETDLAKLAERMRVEAADVQERANVGDSDSEPYFSLVTGGYKSRKQYGAVEIKGEEEVNSLVNGAVELRKSAGTVSKFVMNSAAGTYLNEKRTWKGVEVKQGETAVEGAAVGRSGVASGYTAEGEGEQK